MSRELCQCRKPIISIDSYIENDEHGHMIQVQKYGCRNKECSMYNVAIRETRVNI